MKDVQTVPRTKRAVTAGRSRNSVRDLVAEIERRAITARIQQARKEAGLTQPEMAEALNVEPRTYQNYESKTSPRVPWGSLDKIEQITGKDKRWLIHGSAPDVLGQLGGDRLQRIEALLTALAEHAGLSVEAILANAELRAQASETSSAPASQADAASPTPQEARP